MIYLNIKSNKILLDLLATYNLDLFDHKTDIYLKLEQEGYDSLVIEKQEPCVFSLTHSFVQNGDLMYDPSMEFLIKYNKNDLKNPNSIKIYPLVYINHLAQCRIISGQLNNSRDNLSKHNPNSMRDGADFANTWLKNIKDQQWYLPRKKRNPIVKSNHD